MTLKLRPLVLMVKKIGSMLDNLEVRTVCCWRVDSTQHWKEWNLELVK